MHKNNLRIVHFTLFLILLGIMLVAVFPELAFAASGDVTRISVTDSGAQSNGFSDWATLSADGRYIAFNSDASNLVSGDTNGVSDSFVRDTVAGTTTRISVDSNGMQANGHSYDAVISADGRYVTFLSLASNLAAGDDIGTYDVFVHDMQTGATECASIDLNGMPGGGYSYHQSISADGRYIAFNSSIPDLVWGDTNSVHDVFIRDMQTGTTTRISVDANGVQGNSGSYYTGMSADGRYVTFHSAATNLVANDSNGQDDIFVYDTQMNAITRVSIDSGGAQSLGGNSWYPSISADGRFVAFRSSATNLVSGDTNESWDIFMYDRQTSVTTRVSVDSSGVEADNDSLKSSISADGRYVVFDSYATNLVQGDTNWQGDIFQHDMLTGTTTRISVDSNGAQSLDGESFFPSISSNGQYVAFTSYAANLVEGDTNSNADIFVYEQDTSPIATQTFTLTATDTPTFTPTLMLTATDTPTFTPPATVDSHQYIYIHLNRHTYGYGHIYFHSVPDTDSYRHTYTYIYFNCDYRGYRHTNIYFNCNVYEYEYEHSYTPPNRKLYID